METSIVKSSQVRNTFVQMFWPTRGLPQGSCRGIPQRLMQGPFSKFQVGVLVKGPCKGLPQRLMQGPFSGDSEECPYWAKTFGHMYMSYLTMCDYTIIHLVDLILRNFALGTKLNKLTNTAIVGD